MFDRILIPLDGSRFGSRALKYASEIAHRFGAELILVQVVTPATPIPTTTGMTPVVENPVPAKLAVQAALDKDKRSSARAARYLRTKVRELRSRDIKASYKVVIGDPANSIMEFSDKEHVDLIVMTTHGKSGLKRALMGSVADLVIRESGKPVLVIRPHINSRR